MRPYNIRIRRSFGQNATQWKWRRGVYALRTTLKVALSIPRGTILDAEWALRLFTRRLLAVLTSKEKETVMTERRLLADLDADGLQAHYADVL